MENDIRQVGVLLVTGVTGRIVPPMSVGVVRFCKDAGGHLVLAGSRVVVYAEGDAGVSAWRP